MAGRVEQNRDAHIMVARRQREGPNWEAGITFQDMAPVTCFL